MMINIYEYPFCHWSIYAIFNDNNNPRKYGWDYLQYKADGGRVFFKVHNKDYTSKTDIKMCLTSIFSFGTSLSFILRSADDMFKHFDKIDDSLILFLELNDIHEVSLKSIGTFFDTTPYAC